MFQLPDLIATQDPLPTSDDVFWTMVWQENVRVVVRLSSDVDPSQIPVRKYWYFIVTVSKLQK